MESRFSKSARSGAPPAEPVSRGAELDADESGGVVGDSAGGRFPAGTADRYVCVHSPELYSRDGRRAQHYCRVSEWGGGDFTVSGRGTAEERLRAPGGPSCAHPHIRKKRECVGHPGGVNPWWIPGPSAGTAA